MLLPTKKEMRVYLSSFRDMLTAIQAKDFTAYAAAYDQWTRLPMIPHQRWKECLTRLDLHLRVDGDIPLDEFCEGFATEFSSEVLPPSWMMPWIDGIVQMSEHAIPRETGQQVA